jgi:molybdopterin synthase sulfur carrier subunit
MIVEFYSTLRLDLKLRKIEIELSESLKVEELLHLLSKKIGYNIYEKLVENGKPITGTNILINGKNFHHLQKLQTVVSNDDLIQIFPPAAGG